MRTSPFGAKGLRTVRNVGGIITAIASRQWPTNIAARGQVLCRRPCENARGINAVVRAGVRQRSFALRFGCCRTGLNRRSQLASAHRWRSRTASGGPVSHPRRHRSRAAYPLDWVSGWRVSLGMGCGVSDLVGALRMRAESGPRTHADILCDEGRACLRSMPASHSTFGNCGTARGMDDYLVGFHSLVSFCASAICPGVISRAMRSRKAAALSLPCIAAKLSHIYALMRSCGTPKPLS